MRFRNTATRYGLTAILMHWLVVMIIIIQVAIGWWMVDLDYYDAWYKQAPFIHKSVGIGLAMLMVVRLSWRLQGEVPGPEPSWTTLETILSNWVHRSMYLVIFLILISGYFISTADGRPIAFFNWFEVPALVFNIENQEDIAGEIHFYLVLILLMLVALHSAGAIKHHFINKDQTLKRMLGTADHR